MSDPPKPTWREIDLLRALAAVCMIANHFAIIAARGEAGGEFPVSVVSFVGAFAPVFFFTLTGIGHGVQSFRERRTGLGDALARFLLLYAADAAIWISPSRWVGMDFLGFIALSAVVLDLIRALPRGGVVALAVAVLVVAVRFGAGPWFRARYGPAEGDWLAFFLGVVNRPGFSYPVCPWLSFPMVGYVLGRWAESRRRAGSWNSRRAALAALVAGALLATVTAALAARGAVLFRWGSMSFAYMIAAWSAVAIGVGWALLLAGASPKWSDRLALGGVESLAVVPIHYVLIDGFVRLAGGYRGPLDYAAGVAGVALLSLAAAGLIAPLARLASRASGPVGLALLAVAALGLWGLGTGPVGGIVPRATIQVALCVWLAMSRMPRQRGGA